MSDAVGRDVLPIPDRPHVGLTTYDAKDPATTFPPIRDLRPPDGAPNVLIILIDDVGLRGQQRVRRPDPHPQRRAARCRRTQVQPVPHHRPVLPDAGGPAQRPQPPQRRDGRHHRDRHIGAGLQLGPTEHGSAARRGPQAQRLQHRPVRQVSRGAGLADQPDGALRQLADRLRLRTLLRLHRWRDQPVRPGHLPGHGAGRARPDRGGGLSLHRGHDRPRHRLDPPAEGPDGGQAVLRLLRAGCHPRAAPRPDRVVRQVQGQVRPGLGQAARGDVRPPEGARGHPGRRGADRTPRGDPRLGRHARRPQAGAGPPDGGLRRLPRAHRPPRRSAARLARATSGSPTTRSSTTSSATTAPRPRARRPAASTSWSSSTARSAWRRPSSWSP